MQSRRGLQASRAARGAERRGGAHLAGLDKGGAQTGEQVAQLRGAVLDLPPERRKHKERKLRAEEKQKKKTRKKGNNKMQLCLAQSKEGVQTPRQLAVVGAQPAKTEGSSRETNCGVWPPPPWPGWQAWKC